MPIPTSPTPLLPVLLDYLALAGAVDSETADAACGRLEQVLARGEVFSADDLFAKARYLQACGRLDPALIPMEALDTLVAGAIRVLGPSITSADCPIAAAA